MAIRKRGFWVGVFLFLAIIFLPSPAGLTESAWLVAAVAVLMVTWWATEAIPQMAGKNAEKKGFLAKIFGNKQE